MLQVFSQVLLIGNFDIQDYKHLRPGNFEYVIGEAEKWIARKYITAIFQKKITFKTVEERREAAEKMVREAGHIAALLAPAQLAVASSASPASSASGTVVVAPHEAIVALAEVVKSDLEILSLEIHGLLKKYPDLTQDQLVCLLSLRGDVGRLDTRQMAADLLADGTNNREANSRQTILSQVHVNTSIFA